MCGVGNGGWTLPAGMYRPSTYLLARFMLEVPMMFVLSIFAVSVAPYGISGYNGEYFHLFLCIYTIMLWSFECIAQVRTLSHTLS